MTTTKFEQTDLNCYRGDTETYTFNVTSGGSAYTLSGYTIVATGRASEDETSTLFSITITDGQIGSSFSSGVVVFRIPATTSATLPAVVVYDIQATSGSTVTTIAKGRIKVTKDVSRT